MKKAGRVKSWHADKGYGFIDIHADMKDVFFHVSALQTRAVAPKPGDRVSFELAKGKDGRMQALNVAIAGAPKSRAPSSASWRPALVGLLALAIMVGGALAGYLPRPAAIASALASAVAFLAYATDKARASRSAWRIPEAHLHLHLRCAAAGRAPLPPSIFCGTKIGSRNSRSFFGRRSPCILARWPFGEPPYRRSQARRAMGPQVSESACEPHTRVQCPYSALCSAAWRTLLACRLPPVRPLASSGVMACGGVTNLPASCLKRAAICRDTWGTAYRAP